MWPPIVPTDVSTGSFLRHPVTQHIDIQIPVRDLQRPSRAQSAIPSITTARAPNPRSDRAETILASPELHVGPLMVREPPLIRPVEIEILNPATHGTGAHRPHKGVVTAAVDDACERAEGAVALPGGG